MKLKQIKQSQKVQEFLKDEAVEAIVKYIQNFWKRMKEYVQNERKKEEIKIENQYRFWKEGKNQSVDSKVP